MNDLSERLMEELNSSVAFTIPIGKGIPVSSSLAVTWGIMLAPVLVPLPFSFYFDIFDGCIQAYVFVFLTSLFIREAIE